MSFLIRPTVKALFEKIEDAYDLAIAEEAHRTYERDPKTYSMEEVKSMLDS